MPRGKTAQSQVDVLIKKFERMRIGQSFFVEGVKRTDMEFLRRPAQRLGLGIRIMHVESDEIYCVPGVRVWREEGEYDDL